MTNQEASSLVCKNFVNLCTNFPYLREAFGMLIDLGKQPRTVAEIRVEVEEHLDAARKGFRDTTEFGYLWMADEFQELLDFIDGKEGE